MNEVHYVRSSYREKLIEHLFIGELLKFMWQSGQFDIECLRPEVDCTGYDIVLAKGAIVRHVQLKASFTDARTKAQKVNANLWAKPAGCVIWIQFDQTDMSLKDYLWFGNDHATPLHDLSSFKIARHTKANMQGIKAERANIRVVPVTRFKPVDGINGLCQQLFGPPVH
ncbi:MAG: hypothetical protein QM770_14770 [Tepidisphaeraceae bacterium]